MECGPTYPLPEEKDTILAIRGEPLINKNFAMSAILHSINAKRFCYYIGDSGGTFDNLTAFDECTFRTDSSDFLIPKNADSAESVMQRIQEVDRRTSPALVVVETPRSCTPYGIVNILGHTQDLQLRLESTCVILVNDSEIHSLLSERLLKFYKLRVYQAFRWGLTTKTGEVLVSFVEKEGRLARVL